MSQNTTLIMIPQTVYTAGPPPNTTVVGNSVTGASYYLSSQDIQTVSWSVTDFKGTIIIQASLVDTPTSNNDWFTVFTVVYNNIAGTTINSYNNILGNFLYLRATISNFTGGTVNNVKVSY